MQFHSCFGNKTIKMQVKYNEILFLNSKKYDNKHTTCVGLYIFELKSFKP